MAEKSRDFSLCFSYWQGILTILQFSFIYQNLEDQRLLVGNNQKIKPNCYMEIVTVVFRTEFLLHCLFPVLVPCTN